MKVLPSRFHGGLSLEQHKTLSSEADSIRAPIPSLIALPLDQHFGRPAEVLVKPGDRVFKGQHVARSGEAVSVPVHASTSGRVLGVRPHPGVRRGGARTPCILIEPDGEDRWCELRPVAGYQEQPPGVLQDHILDCGIMGLGGSGFPTHIKVREGRENAVDMLILNGMECEPYVSCDDRLLREKAECVAHGARMLRRVLQAGRCIIALRESMTEAACILQPHLDEEIELLGLEDRFPIGGEKQLIQAVTGKQVPSGELAIHSGVLVHNVATAVAVYRAVTHGEPLISRYVTVTGAVDHPRNLQVLLGTSVRHCLAQCHEHPLGKTHHVIAGGPMTGERLQDLDAPITKTLGCVLVMEEPPEPPTPNLPCIRCGRCVEVCPAGLLPQLLYQASLRRDTLDGQEQARRLGLFDCIECGCCSYVCPSRLPLVESYRDAKEAVVREEHRREEVDHARLRNLERGQRLGAWRAAREQDQEQSIPGTPGERRTYVEQAVARARARTRARAQIHTRDRAQQDAVGPADAGPDSPEP